MTTALDILNLGLSKISASSVSNINPPRTPLERRMAASYPHWRDSELRKRIWLFAKTKASLTLVEVIDDDEKPYKFILPNDCIRPLRERINGAPCPWVRRGNHLYSSESTCVIYYIRRAMESEFDPSFVSLLACRVAIEESGPSTESNTKRADMKDDYKEALSDAARTNAYEIGEEDPENDYDEGFDFVTARL